MGITIGSDSNNTGKPHMATKRGPQPKTPEDWFHLEIEASQLFTPATPIDMQDYLNGRKSQIRDMLEATMERGRHVVLYGERGTGKTSLAKTFKLLFPDTLKHIFSVRVSVDSLDGFSSLWRKIFRDLQIEITRDGAKEVVPLSELYDRSITPDDVRRELARMFRPNDIPILIIDEFNELKSAEARNLMSHTLKALSDDGVNVTIVIVGVGENVTELIANHPSVQRCLAQIKMPRMLTGELDEILDTRLPYLGIEISDRAQERITGLSRGLPSYVHYLGLEAVKAAANRRHLKIDDGDVDLAIQQVLKKTEQSNGMCFAQAVHSNRTDALYRPILLACALARPDDEAGHFVAQSVCSPLSQLLKKDVSISTFDDQLKAFATEDRGGIILRSGKARKYKYRFADPMMQPFVIMKGIEQGLINSRSLTALAYQPQKRFPI
jgi:Cdc6-like AAA superfamily ATPase